MAKYKMKYYGSVSGAISKLNYSFDMNQIIEAEEGEFDKSVADLIVEPKVKKKKNKG